jgi:outer membrane protein OmpA-like peptidoglycan-associated protein
MNLLKTFLIAGTAVLTISTAQAHPLLPGSELVAQANPPGEVKKQEEREKRPAQPTTPPPTRQNAPEHPQAAPHEGAPPERRQAPVQHEQPPQRREAPPQASPPAPRAPEQRVTPPAAREQEQRPRELQPERRTPAARSEERRREEQTPSGENRTPRREEQQPSATPPKATTPAQPHAAPQTVPTEQPRREQTPRETPPTPESTRPASPPSEQEGEPGRPPSAQPTTPAPSRGTAPPPAPPSTQTPLPSGTRPLERRRPNVPAQQNAPAPQPQTQSPPAGPATTQPQTQTAPPKPGSARAPTQALTGPEPQHPKNANEFIRQGGAPAPTVQDLHRERRETRQGNRTIITEGDRTIVQEGNRTFIQHRESERFAVGAQDVRVERRGNDTYNVVQRPGGVQIISVTDPQGHLVRRLRRDPDGREVVIIDDTFLPPDRRDSYFIDVPPPRITIPEDEYIVELDRAPPERVYQALTARPVERIEQRYTIDQVRYNVNVRDLMPRVDLDVNFDTGSWQITPDQIDNLAEIAQAMNRAIERKPREVYLIEGHTDAVGSPEDNLSLSDRRAESVAVALTERFQVPPENLVTQGYGAQGLKVQTQGPSRENRRVAIRRITPLIDRTAMNERR